MTLVDFALIVSMGLNVLLSVLVFRFADKQTRVLDRAHERTTEYTKDLLDRLMVKDWGEFRALQDKYDLTVVEEPEIIYEPTLGPDRGGFGSRLGLVAYGAPDDEIRPEEEMP